MQFLGVVLMLAALAAAIWVYVFVTGEFANIAERKGYDRRKYWHVSFWLGAVGDFLILALPDLKARELQQKQLEQLQELNRSLMNGAAAVQQSAVQTASAAEFDLPQL